MSQMKQLLDRFDNRKLARTGDPERYRRDVATFLGDYDLVRSGSDQSAERVKRMLAGAGEVMTHITSKTDKAIVAMLYSVMRSEVSRLDLVTLHFANIMDHYYNREERTRENVNRLWDASLFEVERIKSETKFVDRLFSQEWRFAKRMRGFASRKIEAFKAAERPQETVVYVPVPQQSGGWQPGTPSYGGF